MADVIPMAGMTLKARLKKQAEQRYTPQPLDQGEFGTNYYRRIDGFQLDELVKLKSKDPQVSQAKYDAHMVAMALVPELGETLTWQEVLELGPGFYSPAARFVEGLTFDYVKAEESEKEADGATDEPTPFLSKPGVASASPAPSEKPSSKSATTKN